MLPAQTTPAKLISGPDHKLNSAECVEIGMFVANDHRERRRKERRADRLNVFESAVWE